MDRTDIILGEPQWKVLESKCLFKHKFLTVRSDTFHFFAVSATEI